MREISIHALREEGDTKTVSRNVTALRFLSTPSARRATVHSPAPKKPPQISIHALREEGDALMPRKMPTRPTFLSTPSARRATDTSALTESFCQKISIHALREEGDLFQLGKIVVGLFISIHALREEGDSKNGEKHLRFCFIIKRSAQIWKSLSKNIRKNSCDLHRTA